MSITTLFMAAGVTTAFPFAMWLDDTRTALQRRRR